MGLISAIVFHIDMPLYASPLFIYRDISLLCNSSLLAVVYYAQS